MRRLLALAAFVMFVVVPGSLAPRLLHASKATTTVSPGRAPSNPLSTARLLASHGEPRLALNALLDAGASGVTNDDQLLTARLLAETGRPAAAESLLADLDTGQARAERFRTILQRARLLLDAARYDAALSALATIETMEDPLYGAYRDYVAARALLGRGEAERAVTALERAGRAAPAALRPAVDGARADVYRALGRSREALAASGDAIESSGDAAERRRRIEMHVGLALELDEDAEAWRAARRLFDEHPRSAEAEACAVAIMRRPAVRRSSADFLLAAASALRSRGRADVLRSVMRVLDDRRLSAAAGEEHRLLWGEYHYLAGDFSRAIALARPSYGDPALRARSMLLMARSFKRVGRGADAAVLYERFAAAFPNDALAAEALYAAASLYREEGRDADSARVLDDLSHAYPSTFHGWAASMARAQALASSGQRDDAAAILEQWLARSRRTDEAALFYLARLERSAGRSAAGQELLDELRRVNPYSFYACPDPQAWSTRPVFAGTDGAVAGLGAWLSDAAGRRNEAYERVLEAAKRAEWAGPPADIEAARAALARGRFFLAAGFRDWAERELDVARKRGGNSAPETLEMARLYDDHAMPWRSVRLYERARSGIPWDERRAHEEDFRYLTHPLAYPAQVLDASRRDAIAPHLLYGMMREESRFDTDAVSRAGAVGLMQLMPATARQVAREIELPVDVDDRLGDPEVNVSIGSWYAADLLRSGEGSAAWMLAAYNAGPGAARGWMRPGVTGDAVINAVESIDYRETRGYVKRVVESANVYHELYFDGGARASSGPR